VSESDVIWNQAVQFLNDRSSPAPRNTALVKALLEAEQVAKQERNTYGYEQFVGAWRLGFVTGTQKAQKRAGVVLGAGRFLPRWVQIELAYGPAATDSVTDSESLNDRGQAINTVKLAGLELTLTGPAWLRSSRILTFDFTRMKVQLGGLKLYEGFIRGGQEREAKFYEQGLKEQAFFSYFWVNDRGVAARGRGGGLALWFKG
jgi:hypothetical protein